MTGEKSQVIEMHQQGHSLGETVEAVDRHPGVILNYLLRARKISQPVSYEEARKMMPGFQKRFNQKSARFADHRGAGFTLGQWAAFYGYPITDVFKAVEEDIGCPIMDRLDSDVQAICAREKQKTVEQSDYKTSPNYLCVMHKSWNLLYSKTDFPLCPIFEGKRSLCSIRFHLVGPTGNEVFLIAVLRLFTGLTGVMADSCTMVNNSKLHFPPSSYGGGNDGVIMSVSIIAVLNISAIDSFVKAWANKYCFVLQKFEYLSEEITIQSRLNLQQIVDESLEDGEN
jgi:hypothetical protein